MVSPASPCPVAGQRDDRKSAAMAAREYEPPAPGLRTLSQYTQLREVLRNPKMKQGMSPPGVLGRGGDQIPVVFLDGDVHKRRRALIARYFTPKAIQSRYVPMMEQTADRLLAPLRAGGKVRLDDISFDMAAIITAEVVGLNDGDPNALSRHIAACLSNIEITKFKGIALAWHTVKVAFNFLRFFLLDVKPAIRRRRKQPQEDVITHLIEEGYSAQQILTECVTYGAAGMVTTREFICMVAWHLFDNPSLKDRYLADDTAGQIAILEEILRLEPVASVVYRRPVAPDGTDAPGPEADDSMMILDIRAANIDEVSVGECPLTLDPDRGPRMKVSGGWMSFADGPHRCPGAQLALTETRIFIDKLFRIAGVRLERVPDMQWNQFLTSYELRNMIVAGR